MAILSHEFYYQPIRINSMALQRMISEINTWKEENAETKQELADLKALLAEKGVI